MKILLSIVFVLLVSPIFSQNNEDKDSILVVAESGDGIESIKAYNELAKRLIMEDPTKAMEYSIIALDFSIKENYPDGVAYAFNNIGVFYKNQGMYANALNYYNKALEIFIENENKIGEAFALSNIATIYSISQQFDKALENYLYSFRLLKNLGLKQEMVGVLNNLGNIYKERNEDFRAIKIYEEALKISEEETSGQSSDPLINIGNVYNQRREFDKALENYNKALTIETEKRDRRGMASCYLNIATTYKRQGNNEMAENYLQRAKLSALDVNAKPILKEVYNQLAIIYRETGNVEKSYENVQLYSSVVDDLYSEQMNKNIKDLEINYSLIKSEEDYEKSRFQSLQNRIKDTNIESFFIMGVMAMIVVIAFIFILYQLKRERKFYS